MLLKSLCCVLLFALIQTGWSASEYLFASYRREQANAHRAHRYISLQQQYKHENAAYEKNYFFFSAPQDKTDETETLKNLFSAVKKRQQIVFIKTPVNDAYEKALQTLLQNTGQQKTHIYVYSKDTDYADLGKKFKKLQKNIQNKPEVHFIKYRNPLEAKRIHSSIIQQYGNTGDNKFLYSRSLATDNTPVSKNYAMNFLPTGVDVVPGSSYIPLFLI